VASSWAIPMVDHYMFISLIRCGEVTSSLNNVQIRRPSICASDLELPIVTVIIVYTRSLEDICNLRWGPSMHSRRTGCSRTVGSSTDMPLRPEASDVGVEDHESHTPDPPAKHSKVEAVGPS
jgi:hypothetical protein